MLDRLEDVLWRSDTINYTLWLAGITTDLAAKTVLINVPGSVDFVTIATEEPLSWSSCNDTVNLRSFNPKVIEIRHP